MSCAARFLPAVALTAFAAAPAMAEAANAIPEPGSISLLVLGATGLILGRRLSRRR